MAPCSFARRRSAGPGRGDRPCGEAVDGHFRRAGAAGDGIDVARIGDQRGMGEARKAGAGQQAAIRRAQAAGGDGAKIAGQAPPGVEGRAKAGDGRAAQQGFKAEERGYGPDLIHHADQGDGIGMGQDQVGQGGTFGIGNGTGAQACHHIGVGFVDQHGIRVGLPRGL